ncbi:Putative transcriptional regulator for fatty acid degradation FadP, TetR family protein [Minicystis rosea]|nr:Putative transcriptional regulator for fatty acid degradation FadP, TetR family protein [Minicystis rosea]
MTKGEDTRATVLDAALALASEEGLSGVTIGRLAERVGMSKSGLFAHFSSKENLAVEILKEATDRFVSSVVTPALKARRGEPRVVALFDRWLAWERLLPGGCIFVVAAVELDDKTCPAREILASAQKDWIETIATAARIAVDEGHFRADLDVRQFAHEVYCLGYGHHFVARLVRDPKAEARTRTAFTRLVRDARRPD